MIGHRTERGDRGAIEAGSPPAPSGYSVADLSRRWKVGQDKIHAFIRRGALIAFNVASTLSGRPQWRITPEEVKRFEQRRSSAPAPKPPKRRRQTVVDYFPD